MWSRRATAPAGEPGNTKAGEPGAAKEGDSQLPALRVDEPNRKPRRFRSAAQQAGDDDRSGTPGAAARHGAHCGAARAVAANRARHHHDGGQRALGSPIAGCAYRNGRRLFEQHLGGDEGQHAAGEHTAVGQRPDEGLHQGSGASGRHRHHPLRSGSCDPSGRRQPRRAHHSRRRLEREFLRQRLPRRRPVLPGPLQRPERRNPAGPERVDVRSRCRRRPSQPHAQGGGRHEGLRCDVPDRFVRRSALHLGCRPGGQR